MTKPEHPNAASRRDFLKRSLGAAAGVAAGAVIGPLALGPAAALAAAKRKTPEPPPPPKTAAAPTDARIDAVPTFECVGLYWSHPQGAATVAAQVAYRAAGETAWRNGLDLWFDGRGAAGRPAEYRGSIVGLRPGTRYEVRLTLAGTPVVQTLQVVTWRDVLPIAKVVELPATSSAMLEISGVNGSPDGYILYTGPKGTAATIDVAGQAPCNIRVTRSSYVIIRGLTLIGGQAHGIVLGDGPKDDVHDVIVEHCDISQWGANDKSGFGVNHHSGVYSNSRDLERIVVQRCRIHNPRSNSNSWKQNREGGKEEDHPRGPQAISFMYGKGQYVVRYNELFGDPTHHFNDSMGADQNFSEAGFPNRDSDIYGNYVAYVWDDGIELEGAVMNVRLWGNYITETYHPIANAAVSMGPMYIWRNVAHVSRTGPNDSHGQCFMKSGGNKGKKGGYFNDGRVYVLNNTVLVTGKESQVLGGIDSGNRTLTNYVTRNNILHVPQSRRSSIDDDEKSETNSFDYDLYNGTITGVAGSEAHGIQGTPTYAPGVGFDLKTMTGRFYLAPGSPGFKAGAVVPNFTDGHAGPAPDVGAHESGTPPMQFGVKAYLTGSPTSAAGATGAPPSTKPVVKLPFPMPSRK